MFVTLPSKSAFPNTPTEPMPTLPLFATNRLVAVEEPTTSWGAELLSGAVMESFAHGEVVPMPTLPPK